MTGNKGPERAGQRQKSRHYRDQPPLQPAWRADANQLPHEQSEIEARDMNQQPLPNVGVAAEVHAAHAASLIKMGKRPFESLATEPQQAHASWAANAPTIAVHRVARLRVLLPVPSAAIRFGDVAADPHGFEIYKRLIAVIALVADHLLDSLAVRLDRLDLLSGFNQGLNAGGGVAVVRILHRHADDRAGLQIDGMLGFVGQVRAPIL